MGSEVGSMHPPEFSRSPRVRSPLPKGEVELSAPPTPLPMPGLSMLTMLPMLVGVLPSVIGMATTGNRSPLIYVGWLAPSLVGVLISVISYIVQKRSHKRQEQEQRRKYDAEMKAARAQLERWREQQRTALVGAAPPPAGCLARAEKLDAHLWERVPLDPDFLSLRLGLGAVPALFSAKLSRSGSLAPAQERLQQQAEQMVKEFATVTDVPICLPVEEAGVSGIVGPRSVVLNAVRSLVIQVTTHHSPDEVKLVALYPAEEAAEWEWMRWLPHIWTDDRQTRMLASNKAAAHRLLTDLLEFLNQRKLQLNMESSSAQRKPLPYFLFIMADPRLLENERIQELLLQEGTKLGALPIYLAERRDQGLPKESRCIAELNAHQGQLVRADLGTHLPFQSDSADTTLAEQFARVLAPIRLRRTAVASDIPTSVPLLSLLGVNRLEELDLLGRWEQNKPWESMAAPLGLRAGGEPLLIDLHERAHGPHGLVAGATGAGKSELLQSLIGSLAVTFHPHELAFLLVDYKGGGMANFFKNLPHHAGTLTNLEGSLAKRALVAIQSELKRRQKTLAQAGVNHIDDYHKLRRKGDQLSPLPRLVILVDEFAQLKMEQPDFIRELVGAIRVGRSLGVHLILATQKPAGVVDEQIWGNTRFRLCLRVERPEDSMEVLKRPEAASIRGKGRAYFQVGNGERFDLFQAAYSGLVYSPGEMAAADPEEILLVEADGSRRSLTAQPKKRDQQAEGPTQLQALVAYLSDVCERAGIAPAPGPWVPELDQTVMPDALPREGGWDGEQWQPHSRWLEPTIGIYDAPDQQYKGPLSLGVKDGHLAVFGAPGTGKSTFLQSLATALARDHSPLDLHIYALDFGGRSLSLLSGLPHVGAIITTDEAERVVRLFRFLLRELDERQQRFAKTGVSTFAAYRSTGAEPIPAILVLIDNYTAFAQAYQDEDDHLARLAALGATCGIYLVLTANSHMMIRARMSSNISSAITFQLADKSDYDIIVGRTNGIHPMPFPGRGLVKGAPPREFQCALPANGESEWDRGMALKTLAQSMRERWTGPYPHPIETLREVIPLRELLPTDVESPAEAPGALAVPAGVEVDDLTPFRLDLRDGTHYLVTGPAESGKTTFLQAVALSLATALPPTQLEFYLVDGRGDSFGLLRRLPQVQDRYLRSSAELDAATVRLAAELDDRRRQLEEALSEDPGLRLATFLSRLSTTVLLIDDYDLLRDSLQFETLSTLARLVRRERNLGVHLFLASSSSNVNKLAFGDEVIGSLKEMQIGFVLGSGDGSDLNLLGIQAAPSDVNKLLPPGQGYYTRRGRSRRIKVATPQAGDLSLHAWIEQLRSRNEVNT